jgi:polysaccharide deacetylase 2 family uncharacterized protein YibQ
VKRDTNKPPAGSAGKKAGGKPKAAASKRAGKGQPQKKKKPKKIIPIDRVRDRLLVALLAAVIILIAAIIFLAGINFHSVRDRNETIADTGEEAAQTVEAPPAVELTAAPIPAPAAPASPPVKKEPAAQAGSSQPAASAPTVKTPPATQTSAAQPVARTPSPPARTEPPAVSEPLPVKTAVSLPPGGVTERPVRRGSLVFVIDDAGHNLRDLEPFLKFPGPLTIAVLPGLPYSAEAARRIRAAGKEVFLHQPMEALGGQNPGPGAIRAGMGRDEIRAIINANLDEVGPVAGLNNHEGSRVTMDDDAMEAVLSVCRERGIVFLDSRTTAETAAPRAARLLGMVIGERDVFVDNVQSRESMAGYINTGLSHAEQQGMAIMIGHVWSPDLAPLLTELFPDLTGQGYTFSTALNAIRGIR